MHHVLRSGEIRPQPDYAGHSVAFGRSALVDRAAGSVHMGLGLCALPAGGHC